MSGGVDSSVAAYLLVKQGFDVIGITLQLWDYESAGRRPGNERGCCDVSSQMDARFVCSQVGIQHIVLDLREKFSNEVVRPYENTYLKGWTPNPCVACNTKLKWGAVLEKAGALGLDYIATGHYAQIVRGKEGVRLEKGVDLSKDQSYALWEVPISALSRTILPLGKWTKKQIREVAKEIDLRTASKPESQDVCFIPDHYDSHLRENYSEEVEKIGSGDIVNQEGQIVGRHKGFFSYTIGQRKGLNISDGKGPYYVSDLDPEKNRVVIGNRSTLSREGLIAQKVNWVSFGNPDRPEKCKVKIRYNDRGKDAIVYPEENGLIKIRFKNPLDAVTPGQSVVWYKGNAVWGGGIISRAIKTFEKDSSGKG